MTSTPDFTLDHLGIAVKSIESAAQFYCDTLGLSLQKTETVETEGVKVAFLDTGNSRIELLEALGPDSPIAKFIGKKGEGIHHVALAVPDIDAAVAQMRKQGVKLLEPAPRPGAHNKRVAFVHPKSANGVLLELCGE